MVRMCVCRGDDGEDEDDDDGWWWLVILCDHDVPNRAKGAKDRLFKGDGGRAGFKLRRSARDGAETQGPGLKCLAGVGPCLVNRW